jgi:hypothetical protein
MKSLLSVITATILTAATLWSAPDFTELNKAAKQLLATLETLQKELPQVNDAEGTAKALDSWAHANSNLTTAIDDFARKYPDVVKQPQPPPEMAAAFAALTDTKTKYAPVLARIRELYERFHTDPKVAAAFARLLKPVEHAK